MDGVSIVVCCYNSASRLPETIKCLAKQELENNISLEIIIVNNASTDDTNIVAQNIWEENKNSKVDFCIVDEPIPGKSFALEKGINHAKYEYVIICDDDNWLDKSYVTIAHKIISSNNNIGAVGGRSQAVTDIQFPNWWNEYKTGYAIGDQGKYSGELAYPLCIWGAGMVIRRSLFLKTFNKEVPALLTCRKGADLSSGGDSEICMRLFLLGYKLYYSELLVLRHYIPRERLTESYRDRLFKGLLSSRSVLREYRIQINYHQFSKIKKLMYLIKSLILVSYYRFNPNKKQLYQYYINNVYRVTRIALSNVNKEVKAICDFNRYANPNK
jgi:glycosyltransferase involved in cell wall biosynthesis